MDDGENRKIGLTIDEAVDRSGIGRTKIFEAIKLGKLTARKAGRRTIILSDELSLYLKSLPIREAA
ncbi:DNA-binding protein [Mesorhizobium sp.]|uniref:DNA-binding protein n=1 Tax=Mesorhizobium sp. TaxID=1871066 RepID=UPI0012160388|nr:DNA-binding protein [Mesorhizobium sp.]TIQ99516.1 MAG: DNA-binding protein [Mesorhizobium sp.]